MQVPVIDRCTSLIVGSSLAAMVCAMNLANQESVMMVTEDTCLFADITRPADYRLPHDKDSLWHALFFPSCTHGSDGMLHPARLKRHGEDLFDQRGIRLLYASQFMGETEGMALVAHKSGLYGIACKKVYRFPSQKALAEPAFCLHTMQEGQHKVHRVPVSATGITPDAVFRRFHEALEQLPQRESLARCGTDAAEKEGLAFKTAVQEGLQAKPVRFPLPRGRRIPKSHNPLHVSWALHEIPGLQAEHCGKYDVVVAGGGTSGVCAAISSARKGMKVLLLEMNRQLGGTATVGGVSSYWFGLRGGITQEIDLAVDHLYQKLEMPRKPGLWGQDDVFLPDLKAHVLLDMCRDAGVEVRFSSIACGVNMEKQEVQGLYWAQGRKLYEAASNMVIDCTGDGDLVMFAGAAHTYGNAVDGMTYWASLAQFPGPDSYRNNFSTMVHVGDPMDYSRFIKAGRRLGCEIFDHGTYVAPRESRHIHGLETLTLESILSMEPVADPLYVCFSNYDPKGRLTADLVYAGLLPPNQLIPVPRGVHIPVDQAGLPLNGILVGGKAISCTHDAFPALRMQPDLQRQGMALGVLAACAISQGVPAADAKVVVEELIRTGDLSLQKPDGTSQDFASVVDGLTGAEPWDWLDVPVTSYETEPSPIVRLLLAGSEEVLPHLLKAWREPAAEGRKLTLSRLMLWHYDETGADFLIAHIWKQLNESAGLPMRSGSINYGQLLPDHGLMPEVVYLLNSLSRSRLTQVFDLFNELLHRLETGPRDWLDLRSGIYCYCESFAYVAVGRKDPEMIPLLRRVLAFPEMQQHAEDPLLEERFTMLKTTLLSALHRLGDSRGTSGLTELESHPKRIIAQAASILLKAEPFLDRRTI